MNFINKVKEDLNNIKVLIQDGNYRPFWRPVVILLLVILLLNYLNTNARNKVAVVKRKIEAQQAEIDNEKNYKATKAKYQDLLSNLPPSAQKNEWILLQLEAITNKLKLSSDDIKYAKGANINYGIFEISTAVITGALNYNQIGRLVETIENNPQFLRINKLSLSRQENALGKIGINMEVYTAFLEEHKAVSNASGRK